MGRVLLSFLVCAALAASAGCEPTGSGQAVPLEPADRAGAVASSSFRLVAQGDDLRVEYLRAPAAIGPRVAELFIRHSPNLTLVSSEPGDAARAADKRLVVQRKDATTLRVVLFGADNVNALASGTLATLHMRRTDRGPARAELLVEQPLFAPQAALKGLQVGEPIRF